MPRVTRKAPESQRPAPSQSQRAGPSRTQRRRQAESEEEEAEEIDLNVDDAGEPMDEDEENGDIEVEVHRHLHKSTEDIIRKAHDLARLALFNEVRRMPLKREDITKKVLQNQPRLFSMVFQHANMVLNGTFGMQMCELPSRTGLDQEAAAAAAAAAHLDDIDEAMPVKSIKKRGAAVGSKTYILRSTLPTPLIEHAMRTNAEVLEEEAVLDVIGASIGGRLDSDDEDFGDVDTLEVHPKIYGSILSWGQTDQLGALAVLYVILSLILVNGKVMNEIQLHAQLKRLKLPTTAGRSPVHLTTLSTHRSLRIDDYLSQLIRQGYLDRQVIGGEGGGGGASAGRKRTRGKVKVAQAGEDGHHGELYEWRWGPRAFCEIGEEDVARFVAEFMIGGSAADIREEEEEEGGDGDGERGQNRKESFLKMLRGVRKAAGGSLAEIRKQIE